jgi:hypothetical protein
MMLTPEQRAMGLTWGEQLERAKAEAEKRFLRLIPEDELHSTYILKDHAGRRVFPGVGGAFLREIRGYFAQDPQT